MSLPTQASEVGAVCLINDYFSSLPFPPHLLYYYHTTPPILPVRPTSKVHNNNRQQQQQQQQQKQQRIREAAAAAQTRPHRSAIPPIHQHHVSRDAETTDGGPRARRASTAREQLPRRRRRIGVQKNERGSSGESQQEQLPQPQPWIPASPER